jgi:tRNA/tmRNA/rRNA uracil-C5-methylase (TrmA/RlmC/RlmD family)
MTWGSEKEKQIRLRIQLSIAAYAYEFENDSIMSDAEFDEKCLLIDPEMKTGNRKMDNFFKKHFDPSTGQWIHKHPQLSFIRQFYSAFYQNKPK